MWPSSRIAARAASPAPSPAASAPAHAAPARRPRPSGRALGRAAGGPSTAPASPAGSAQPPPAPADAVRWHCADPAPSVIDPGPSTASTWRPAGLLATSGVLTAAGWMSDEVAWAAQGVHLHLWRPRSPRATPLALPHHAPVIAAAGGLTIDQLFSVDEVGRLYRWHGHDATCTRPSASGLRRARCLRFNDQLLAVASCKEAHLHDAQTLQPVGWVRAEAGHIVAAVPLLLAGRSHLWLSTRHRAELWRVEPQQPPQQLMALPAPASGGSWMDADAASCGLSLSLLASDGSQHDWCRRGTGEWAPSRTPARGGGLGGRSARHAWQAGRRSLAVASPEGAVQVWGEDAATRWEVRAAGYPRLGSLSLSTSGLMALGRPACSAELWRHAGCLPTSPADADADAGADA